MKNFEKVQRDFYAVAKPAMWLILVTGIIFILMYFKTLLQPLMIAAIIWYFIKLLQNMVSRIRIGKLAMPGWIQNILSAIIIFAILYLTVEMLVFNIQEIIAALPSYDFNFEELVSKAEPYIGSDLISGFKDKVPSVSELQPLLAGVLNSFTFTMGQIFVIIFYTAFMIFEDSMFARKMQIILSDSPKEIRERRVLKRISVSIRKYVVVKIYVSLLTAFLGMIVLLIFDVNYLFLWTFLLFVLNFIPYIGSFIATLLPAVFAAVQYGRFMEFVIVFSLIEAVQLLVANVIEPRMVGRTLNLSPLVVMVCLVFWGYVWGLLGMIIAVPVTSVLVIVMSQFKSTRDIAVLLSENGELEPIDA